MVINNAASNTFLLVFLMAVILTILRKARSKNRFEIMIFISEKIAGNSNIKQQNNIIERLLFSVNLFFLIIKSNNKIRNTKTKPINI
jgi:hypothetical protein